MQELLQGGAIRVNEATATDFAQVLDYRTHVAIHVTPTPRDVSAPVWCVS